MAGELLIFIVGNSAKNKSATPEIVSLPAKQELSQWTDLPNELTLYNTIWDFNMFGMSGIKRGKEIHLCGGGKHSTFLGGEFAATRRCQIFDLKTYSWTNLNLSMIYERIYAQSLSFENNTWFLFGGEDSQGTAQNSTESVDSNQKEFIDGIDMPEKFSKHCAKLANASHAFTTGGKEGTTTKSSGKLSFVSFHLKISV